MESTETAPGAGMMQPQAIVVETASATATVQAVDMDKRTITLKMSDDSIETFKVSKDVVNLDQVKAGDKVKATYLEEVAVAIAKGGQPAANAETTTMVAPKGAMPGMVTLNTMSITAKIKSVNAKKDKVTLEMPDGKEKTLKLGPKAEGIDQLKKGDTVTVTVTQGFAIAVEKP